MPALKTIRTKLARLFKRNGNKGWVRSAEEVEKRYRRIREKMREE